MGRHNQTDHTLVDMRWDSSILDERSFRRTDSDTDHHLVVANVRERLAVSKLAAQRFDGERFCLRKLSDLQLRNSIRFRFQIRL
jgi:hypothetical protein